MSSDSRMPVPLRLLVICPSWVGDAVMATPALRLLRDSLRAAFIGGLMRPGIDEVLAGSGLFDHVHVDRARGVMGPKRVAAGLRAMRYDTALLLTNSFSTALVARLAWIPRRVGYDRDGRGLLLTDRLAPKRRAGGRGFAVVPAVDYYLEAARRVLGNDAGVREAGAARTPRLELATTAEQDRAAAALLERALGPAWQAMRFCVVNPGANDPAKRWPPERFAAVGVHVAQRHGLSVLVAGSPGEAGLADQVARSVASAIAAAPGRAVAAPAVASLPALGVTLGSLKGVLRRAALLVTNDTGPRHIAAAFGVPTVTLYGPTDPRWTTLPPPPPPAADGRDGHGRGIGIGSRDIGVVADATLGPGEVADDHPDRCRIDRIAVDQVLAAVDRVLGEPRMAGASLTGRSTREDRAG